MAIRCSQLTCKNTPSDIITCERNSFIFCDAHRSQHLEDCSSMHGTRSLYKKIPQSLKDDASSAVLNEVKAVQNQVCNFISQLNLYIQEITKLGLRSLRSLEQYQSFLSFIINSINLNQRVPVNLLSESDQNAEIDTDIIKKITKNYYEDACSIVEEFSKKISDHLEYCLGTNEIELDPVIAQPLEDEQKIENKLFYVETKIRSLMEFDPEKFQLIKSPFEEFGEQPSNQIFCCLPGNKVFVYGGTANTGYIKKTRILNLENFSYEVAEDGRVRSLAQAIYHKKSVYLFGGTDPKNMISADTYNLTTKTWSQLADIPQPANLTTSIALPHSSFLISGITGSDQCLLTIYAIESNSYSLLNSNIIAPKGALLIRDGENAYLFGSKIYLMKVDNLQEWKSAGEVFPGGSFCRPAVYGRKVYFINTNRKLFEFNLDTLALKIITPEIVDRLVS